MSRVDRNSGGFDCKYGNSCTKFNPNNIEEASRLRRLLLNLSERELFSWELIPELFRLFKLEHNKIAKVVSYDKLTNEWKKHFKDYIIMRTSCNNGSLYKSAYDYYNTLNLQKNKISNYDNIKVDDSTFYYNYENKENFINENNSAETVKSYLTKMYSEEVRTDTNLYKRVMNNDNQAPDSGAGSKVKSKYIVMRSKKTYEPGAFTFNASQFKTVQKRIISGELTAKCKTGDTKITETEPKANTDYLMNTTFDNTCKCGKYHINTTAYDLWDSAVGGNKPKYTVEGDYIVYNYSTTEESDNQCHFLAKDQAGNKLNGTNTGAQPGTSLAGPSNNSGNSGYTDSGLDNVGQYLGTTDTGGRTLTDYGDPGMYGSNGGDSKDLAIFINGGTGGSSEPVANVGQNAITDSTNAETGQIQPKNTTGNYDIPSYKGTTGAGATASNTNNSNAPSSAAVSGGANPNNQNQNAVVPPSAAISNGETITDMSQLPTGSASSGGGTAQTTKTLSLSDVDAAISSWGKTVYNESISELAGLGREFNFIPGINNDSHNAPILGLPMMYNPLCDPNGRIYAETTMMDLPIIYMEPGRGRLNNTIDDPELMEELKEAYKDTGIANPQTAYMQEDLRALSFENALTEYMEYFQNICSTVYGNMGLGTFTDWDQIIGNVFRDKSLLFFADTATSISDSFSNEFSDAPLTSSVNNFGVLVRNIKMMTIQDAAQVAGNDIEAGTVGTFQDQSDTGRNRTTLTGILNDILTAGATLWNGSQLLFPQVWNDSRHDRSYSLSFKFFSPYGNKEAIFQKVYLPVLALMTLTLPRMDNISGYAQPFYVRVNAPGYSN